MMISETYSEDVFIADYTNYVIKSGSESVLLYKGVVVGTKEVGIIPSFVIHNEHRYLFEVVNNEHNPAIFKRADGSKVSQCECIIYSHRNDNRKGWMMFLELKYCYFNQDDMLTLKEDTGAVLKAANEVSIQTPAVLKF